MFDVQTRRETYSVLFITHAPVSANAATFVVYVPVSVFVEMCLRSRCGARKTTCVVSFKTSCGYTHAHTHNAQHSYLTMFAYFTNAQLPTGPQRARHLSVVTVSCAGQRNLLLLLLTSCVRDVTKVMART